MANSPDLSHEDAAGRKQGILIAGVDEVGRGPLAGPVIACAVILPDDVSLIPAGITDSKKLTAKRRAALLPHLKAVCTYGLGQASVAEIDSLNILQATFLAMRRALAALPTQPGFALIDGNHTPPGLLCPARPLVKGDSLSLSIAAASIIAKETRDALMRELDLRYPGYDWASNAGYGSARHMVALNRLGPTEHHRMSFSPVREAAQRLSTSTLHTGKINRVA
jgi:ribonuclease HII